MRTATCRPVIGIAGFEDRDVPEQATFHKPEPVESPVAIEPCFSLDHPFVIDLLVGFVFVGGDCNDVPKSGRSRIAGDDIEFLKSVFIQVGDLHTFDGISFAKAQHVVGITESRALDSDQRTGAAAASAQRSCSCLSRSSGC